MNRRQFLKSLVTASVIPPLLDIEEILTECAEMSDLDFVHYIRHSMQFVVDNPRRIGMITGITE